MTPPPGETPHTRRFVAKEGLFLPLESDYDLRGIFAVQLCRKTVGIGSEARRIWSKLDKPQKLFEEGPRHHG